MQNKENTSSVFRYLIEENNILKEEIKQLKTVKYATSNSDLQLIKLNNSKLRQQILSIKAQILICRQIYEQQQSERLQLIQEFSIKERINIQRIIQLQERNSFLEKNMYKKSENIIVTPAQDFLNVSYEINVFMNLLIKLQQKIEKEKQKRRIATVKYLTMVGEKINDEDASESDLNESEQSDLENHTQTTFATLHTSKKIVPKLSMEKAKEVQKIIIERLQLKEKKKKDDIASLKKELQQLKQRYTEISINNFALERRISHYNRYIVELQQRNQRIIKLKADQVPIEAYQLTRR